MTNYKIFENPFPWAMGFWKTLALIMLSIILMMCGMAIAVIALISLIYITHIHIPGLDIVFGTLTVAPAAYFLWCRRRKEPPCSFSDAMRLDYAELGQAWQAINYLMLVALGLLLILLGSFLFKLPPQGSLEWFNFACEALGGAVLAPVLEEILYRGLIANVLRQSLLNGGHKRWGAEASALIIPSVLFAVSHGDPSRIVFLTSLGLATGGVYRSSKSLPCACLLHCLMNTMSLAAQVEADGLKV